MDKHVTYDVIVIGGGPAGASAAAILAEKRRKVVVFEKDAFPRYHIGEVLMPGCYFPLQRLGLIEKMKSSAFGAGSRSLQFLTENGSEAARFDFTDRSTPEVSTVWHVLRSEFDKMLLDHARNLGAEVHEETDVKELIFEGDAAVGVRVENAPGKTSEFRAPVTIDCSGRDALAVVQNGWRVRDPSLNKTAIWTYLAGATQTVHSDRETTTVAFLPQKGWFWHVPLPEDMVSVGVVADREYLYQGSRDPEEIFWREAEKNAWIRTHLEGCQTFEQFFSTGDFTYRSKYCSTDGLLLAGDAFASLDPVFSSGVRFALMSGVMAADAADSALATGVFSAVQFASYGDGLCKAAESMRKLAYSFYYAGCNFAELLKQYPELHGDLRGCLSGDPSKSYDVLFAKMAEFASLPEPLPYGRARIAVDA